MVRNTIGQSVEHKKAILDGMLHYSKKELKAHEPQSPARTSLLATINALLAVRDKFDYPPLNMNTSKLCEGAKETLQQLNSVTFLGKTFVEKHRVNLIIQAEEENSPEMNAGMSDRQRQEYEDNIQAQINQPPMRSVPAAQ